MACGKVSGDSDQRRAGLVEDARAEAVRAADHEREVAAVLLPFAQPLGELQRG